MARAEAVLDQLEKKVEQSKEKLRSRRARKVAWDEVNGKPKEDDRYAVLAELVENDPDAEDWEDDENETANGDAKVRVEAGDVSSALNDMSNQVVVDRTINLNMVAPEDEIT